MGTALETMFYRKLPKGHQIAILFGHYQLRLRFHTYIFMYKIKCLWRSSLKSTISIGKILFLLHMYKWHVFSHVTAFCGTYAQFGIVFLLVVVVVEGKDPRKW